MIQNRLQLRPFNDSNGAITFFKYKDKEKEKEEQRQYYFINEARIKRH